jgi:hypothetical protein
MGTATSAFSSSSLPSLRVYSRCLHTCQLPSSITPELVDSIVKLFVVQFGDARLELAKFKTEFEVV